ncbi:MAG: hypothetical protein ACRYF0_05750 [Janthinobacterium lividum]
MKRTIYRLCTGVLLLAFVASCSTKNEDIVAPRAITADAVPAFNYYQYFNKPEPMIDVTASPYRYTNGPTLYRYPYGLGASVIPGGHPIYSFSPGYNPADGPTAGIWTPIAGPNGGGVVKLAVAFNDYRPTGGPSQKLYAVTDQNQLWSTSNATGEGWINYNIAATDVTAYYYNGFPVVYFLGTENVNGGHKIYRIDSGTTTPVEVLPGSAATSIAVDQYARLWAVNSLHEIFCNSTPLTGGSFFKLQGEATDIACDSYTIAITGSRYLTYGYEVFVRDATTPLTSFGWELQQGEATQIGSNSNGDYFVTNSLNELFLANYRN